ncbi:GH3 family domain-containing protein [Serratia rubidaea]|uniref:GH3 family domain-containing protein n=1 Tax=Serratia rubidaea TaxID=61652 RepID=UPI001F18F3D8|nr:GH3 auxin-responsive promoter family protein [Serratia rubidaea]
MNSFKNDWMNYWEERQEDFNTECLAELERFTQATKCPIETQQNVLRDVISVSKESLHWQERGYSHVSDVDDYRKTLPIMRYDDFIPLIEREIRTKGGVLTCSPVLRWLKTSGTTGIPKRVPYTLHWMLNYRIPAMKAMWGTYIRLHPNILSNPYATLDTQTVRENAQDHILGVPFQSISNRHPRMNNLDWNPPWYEAPWFREDAPTSFEDKMYCRIRHLVGKDLYFINAINPSTLISLRDHISANKEKLIADVLQGTIDGRPICAPDPHEAERLEKTLANPGFTLKDVWPTLGLYACWLSASAGLYQQALEDLFPGVARLPFMSCGTEGVVTIPVSEDVGSQPLAINQAFYEFVEDDVPLGELVERGEKPDTLLAHQLTAGKSYHVIMSQANGLFRLWTGDIYHVDRVVDGTPWIHFLHRDGVFHSFTGEKLTEHQVTTALTQGFAAADRKIGLYLCGPRWGQLPSYVVVAEAREANAGLAEILSKNVESALQQISIEYESKRVSNRLGPVEVHVVPENSIQALVERKRQKGNANQYKYKPFQKDTDFLSELAEQ